MNYLTFLEKEIHSVIMATVDEQGLPVTCAVDIMDSDDKGLYFLTAKGKGFYHRLVKRGYIALTGMRGGDTLSCMAVSVRGKVEEIGTERLDRLLHKNPYMLEIYPTEQSREALTVFRLYEGEGEWFDLSKKPIERFSFTIGNKKAAANGYVITKRCIGCGKCGDVCPQSCMDFRTTPAILIQEHCLHCGNCLSVCPQKAIVKEGSYDAE